MGKQYCMNCFRKVEHFPCPCCGQEPDLRDPQALTGSILAGRYLVGRTLNRTGLEYTYKGMDLVRRRGVQIQEYFPAGHALRGAEGQLLWQEDSLREAGVDAFLQGSVETDPEMPVMDSFLANSTAYILRRRKPVPAKPEVPENPWVPFLIAFVTVMLALVALLSLVRGLAAPEPAPEESTSPETNVQAFDEAENLRAEIYRDAEGRIISILRYDTDSRLVRRELYTDGILSEWTELIYDSDGNYLEAVTHTDSE